MNLRGSGRGGRVPPSTSNPSVGGTGVSPTGNVTGQLPPPRTIPLIEGSLPPPVTIPMSPGMEPARPTPPPSGAPLTGRGTAPPTMPVPGPAPTDPGAPPGRGGTLPFPSPGGGGGAARGVQGIRRRQPGLGGVGPSQYSLDAFRRMGNGPQTNTLPPMGAPSAGEPGVGQLGSSSSGLGFSQPSGGAPQPQWQRVLGLLRGMRF